MKKTTQRTGYIFIFCILCLAAPFAMTAGTGDGYQSGELATFENRAAQVVAAFNSQIAWSPCSNGVNFNRGNISSTDSGVDKPAPDESEKKYGLSFHAGLTFPLGSLRVPYISGGMFGIDLEYDLTQQLTLLGLFGYNYFNSELDILEDTYWWNLSLNLKYKFSTTNSRPFINGGLGLYFPKSGGFPKSSSARPGFNIGVGYNYILRPTLVGEIGVNYHHAFYPGDDLEFLVSYCGLIYRF